jgi:exonuclease III
MLRWLSFLAWSLKSPNMVGGNIPPLSVAAQNCNSLNISTCCDKQLKKLVAITCINTCIIFLSDLRLGNNKAVQDVISAFRYNNNCQYDFYFNSGRSKRGVGILIKNSLNYTITETFKDNSENILGLSLTIDSVPIKLISVYGPNTNDQTFFNDLRRVLQTNPLIPTIIGGDWNLTVSLDDSRFNIDTFNMAAPPSTFRSRQLATLTEEFGLTDPYRALHPDKRDFSYIPRTGANNRSRIDFFMVSYNLIPNLVTCEIEPGLTTSLFDHKCIFLRFERNNKPGNNSIKTSTINHPRFESLLAVTATETCIQHADPNLAEP